VLCADDAAGARPVLDGDATIEALPDGFGDDSSACVQAAARRLRR
jgi:hypothetical protein